MASIELSVPRALPARADGERLERLSATGLGLLYRCPELWRRRYLAGERQPASGAMHLGRCVDEAVSAFYRARLEGAPIDAAAALALYAERWREGLDAEPVVFEQVAAETLRERGRTLLERYLAEVAAGVESEAVQRRIDLRLAPDLAWTLVGYLDLETVDGEIIDLKVKARHVSQVDADASLQAGIYLALRAGEGRPARGMAFHSLAHGVRGPGVRQVATTRDERRLQGVLARVALAAALVADLAASYGTGGTWPLAGPESWSCSRRFCPAFEDCPGGAGL